MTEKRWKVWFSGHVQGVGFRYRTRLIAQNYSVKGWVTNLENGDVQLVVEGGADELKRFVDGIQESMSGFIRATEIDTNQAPTGEFSEFKIR